MIIFCLSFKYYVLSKLIFFKTPSIDGVFVEIGTLIRYNNKKGSECMKRFKKILLFFISFLLIFVLVFPIVMKFYPEQVSHWLGYYVYGELTDKMDPTIPVYSLVFSKLIDEKEKIDLDTVITLNLNYEDKKIVTTRYFRYAYVDSQGTIYYMTQGEGENTFVDSKTIRSDVIAKPALFIPYMGAIYLFLQSFYGILLSAVSFIILLLSLLYKTQSKKRVVKEGKADSSSTINMQIPCEKESKPQPVLLNQVRVESSETKNIIKGVAVNQTSKTLRFVKLQLQLEYIDETKSEWISSFIVGREGLGALNQREWEVIDYHALAVQSVIIRIESYKNE